MQKINYRPFEEKDCDAIGAMYFEHRGYPIKPANQVKADNPRIMAETEEGKIVGFSYGAKLSYDIAELYNIFVHPDYRKQHIGRELFQRNTEQFKQAGFTDLLFVNSPSYENYDPGAKVFHEKNGNKPIWKTENGTLVFYQSLGNDLEGLSKKLEEPKNERFSKEQIWAFMNTFSQGSQPDAQQIRENEKIAREQKYPYAMVLENTDFIEEKRQKSLTETLTLSGYQMTVKTPGNVALFFKKLTP